MNSFQKLVACLMLFAVVLGYGCKKDEDDPVGCTNWANEVTAELNAFIAAETAYYTDQTPANCTAYKVAGQAYVNALQSHVECATLSGQQDQIQAAINSLQVEINAIQC